MQNSLLRGNQKVGIWGGTGSEEQGQERHIATLSREVTCFCGICRTATIQSRPQLFQRPSEVIGMHSAEIDGQ